MVRNIVSGRMMLLLAILTIGDMLCDAWKASRCSPASENAGLVVHEVIVDCYGRSHSANGFAIAIALANGFPIAFGDAYHHHQVL